MRKACWLVAVSVLICAQASAQSAPVKPSECGISLERALELSGFNDAAKAMPEQVHQQIADQMRGDEGMSAETRQKLAAIAQGAFDAPKIVHAVKQNFLHDCDLDMLNSTVQELQSETAKKIRSEEALSLSPESQKGMRAFYTSLDTNPPATSRVVLLERMDKSLAITESTLDMILSISKGMVTGFGGKWGEAAEVEAMKQQYRQSIHEALIANQLFTYRNVSDEDLGKYVSIYETPAVHKFSDQLQQSMLQAMTERSEAMAREFQTYLANNPAQTPKKPTPAKVAPKKTAPKPATPSQ